MSDLTHTLLTLDPAHPRNRAAMTDAHLMHRLVMAGYPSTGQDSARAALGILHALDTHPGRGDDTLRVLVQSPTPGSWETAPGVLDVTTWQVPSLTERTYAFQITAAPTRRRADTGKVTAIKGRSEQVDWLARHLTGAGMNPLSIETRDAPQTRSETKSLPRAQRANPTGTFLHQGVTYTGLLAVTDPEQANAARASGIGRGKAYGLGLLLTQPAQTSG